MGIVYEVNVFVQPQIEAEYRLWLVKHIEEILEIAGFLDAACFDVQQEPGTNEIAICMQYRLDSQASLDNYLLHHAPRLRADGVARFGEGFRANRRVLLNAQEFPGIR